MSDEQLQCMQVHVPGGRAAIRDIRRRLARFPEIDSVLLPRRSGVLEIYFRGGCARPSEWPAALADSECGVEDVPPAV